MIEIDEVPNDFPTTPGKYCPGSDRRNPLQCHAVSSKDEFRCICGHAHYWIPVAIEDAMQFGLKWYEVRFGNGRGFVWCTPVTHGERWFRSNPGYQTIEDRQNSRTRKYRR